MTDDINSKLATYAHWHERYERDLESFKETGNVGDEWYEHHVERILEFLVESIQAQGLSLDCTFLDIGCGNGLTDLRLLEYGLTSIYGIDLSHHAVSLARQLTQQLREDPSKLIDPPALPEEFDWDSASVRFAVCNVMEPWSKEPGTKGGEGDDDNESRNDDSESEAFLSRLEEGSAFDVAYDKGTLDVMVLRKEADKYLSCILQHRFLRAGSLYAVTSCNLTAEEAKAIIQRIEVGVDESVLRYELVDEMEDMPTFTFGGCEGSAVCTLVFKVAAKN